MQVHDFAAQLMSDPIIRASVYLAFERHLGRLSVAREMVDVAISAGILHQELDNLAGQDSGKFSIPALKPI